MIVSYANTSCTNAQLKLSVDIHLTLWNSTSTPRLNLRGHLRAINGTHAAKPAIRRVKKVQGHLSFWIISLCAHGKLQAMCVAEQNKSFVKPKLLVKVHTNVCCGPNSASVWEEECEGCV